VADGASAPAPAAQDDGPSWTTWIGAGVVLLAAIVAAVARRTRRRP
jgi:LPXTG-motif cell wall-anchored protein